jgi:hypothetical protein
MPRAKTTTKQTELSDSQAGTVRDLLMLGCLRLGVDLQQRGAAAIDDVTTELARLANLRDALPPVEPPK